MWSCQKLFLPFVDSGEALSLKNVKQLIQSFLSLPSTLGPCVACAKSFPVFGGSHQGGQVDKGERNKTTLHHERSESIQKDFVCHTGPNAFKLVF